MSRRRKISLAGVMVIAAAGLGCYLPQYLSPVPELVAELRSCLVAQAAEAPRHDEPLDPAPEINVKLVMVGFNCTRAGTPLLADAADAAPSRNGIVHDDKRMRALLVALQGERCITGIMQFPLVRSSGKSCSYFLGGQVQLRSVVDGASVVMTKRTGLEVECVPAYCTSGRIRLEMNWRITEIKGDARDADGNPEFDVAEVRATLMLDEGQTGFIGGLKHRARVTETYCLPLASDLPGIGTWFQFAQSMEIDREWLFLATPRRSLPRP